MFGAYFERRRFINIIIRDLLSHSSIKSLFFEMINEFLKVFIRISGCIIPLTLVARLRMTLFDFVTPERIILVHIIKLFLHSYTLLFLLDLIVFVQQNLQMQVWTSIHSHLLHFLGQLSVIVVSVLSHWPVWYSSLIPLSLKHLILYFFFNNVETRSDILIIYVVCKCFLLWWNVLGFF